MQPFWNNYESHKYDPTYFWFHVVYGALWKTFIWACITVMDLHSQVLVVGWLLAGICKKLPETFPMSNRANFRRLQDGLAADQGRAISNCGSTSGIRRANTAGTAAAGREEWEYARGIAGLTLWSGQREGQEVLQVPKQRFLCSLEGPHTGAEKVWGVLPLRRREGRDKLWQSDCNHHSPSPALLRKSRVKLSPGRREGGGQLFQDLV